MCSELLQKRASASDLIPAQLRLKPLNNYKRYRFLRGRERFASLRRQQRLHDVEA